MRATDSHPRRYYHSKIACSAVAIVLTFAFNGGSAAAAPISTLFNTGVDDNGKPLPDGTIGDAHYSLLSAPQGSTSQIVVLDDYSKEPLSFYSGEPQDNLSTWILPNQQTLNDGVNGEYEYRTTFTLSGFDPATAQIVGMTSSDNYVAEIDLNGVPIGSGYSSPPLNTNQFAAGYLPFSISEGFLPGINTIDFWVTNTPNPPFDGSATGLRVEMTGTASVPEPATFVLAAMSVLILLFGIGRRKRLAIMPIIAVIAVAVQPSQSVATTIIVPGQANPWLAGTPDGTMGGNGFDTVPAESPIAVSGLMIFGGDVLTFSVSGIVSHGDDDPTGHGPDGDLNDILRRDSGAENGIADLRAPIDALIGVFLDNSAPNSLSAPPSLDFASQAARDFLTLSPGLRQPFYIGDGLTSLGLVQQIIAPAGATRLFLGDMDGHQWSNNTGEFIVNLPEPSMRALVSVGVISSLLALRLRTHVDSIAARS
ncbi:MAG TPA: PEP-CTERM sorting domain-containing protein [Pirellulales bacterium]|jgi:hypothetical protein